MKQKDFALIIIVVVVSAVLSIFASKALFSTKSSDQQAEVVQPISTTFTQPDKQYFNKDAFNPTQQITIQQNNNTDPFKGQ